MRARTGETQFMRLRECIDACAAGKYQLASSRGHRPASSCAVSTSGNSDSSFPMYPYLTHARRYFGVSYQSSPLRPWQPSVTESVVLPPQTGSATCSTRN